MPDRFYIADGLCRPTLETISKGVEVFIVAKVFGNGVTMLCGEPSIGVELGRLGSLRSITSAPLSSVTVASGYCLANDLLYAKRTLAAVESQLSEIAKIADQTPCPDWQAAVERIRAVLHPPKDDDHGEEW